MLSHVDNDINVHDRDDVQWAIWNRAAAAEKFIVIPEVESWELERAAKVAGGGGQCREGLFWLVVRISRVARSSL